LREDAEPQSDFWATAAESREDIVDLYRRAAAHSDATIEELSLDAVGFVPWWSPELAKTPLQRVLVHVIAESNRHAGHVDIIRELLDGTAGQQRAGDLLPPVDRAWWDDYRGRLEATALAAAAAAGGEAGR
jgi:hypothetical protein